jgi:DNA polymerase-4
VTDSAACAEPILHVDMDAFYASVEVRERPELAGLPVAVGGVGGRGVVASASYEARAFGVRSAMPMSQARRLCPGLVTLPPDFARYQHVSEQLMTLLRSVTPLVEPLSLDEAFLDVRGAIRLFGAPVEIGHRLRERVLAELDLPASVGVAPNKFLAKLCSGKAKPDGLLHLAAGDVERFLGPLDVRDLWGVGEQSAQRLRRYGLTTVADVASAEVGLLTRILGSVAARHLSGLARGHDLRPVVPYEAAKGMSAEETFARDVDDPELLRRELLRLAEKVARRLRRGGVAARTVTVKLRYANFTTVTRARTLAAPTDEATRLHAEAATLLERLRPDRSRVRLLGVAATNLVPVEAARQLTLLDDDRWARLERAADAARGRFGDTALTRGALLAEETPSSGDAAAAAEDWRSSGDPDGRTRR